MSVEQPIVVSLGEVLWDVFPDGPRFGGAPANFACHAAALGAEAVMVSCVGDDELGDGAVAALAEHGVITGRVQRTAEHATGTVQVKLDESGKPQFSIGADVAWDYLQSTVELEELVARTEAIYFGTLGQRSESSRRTIRQLVAATPASALRVLDVNLRSPFYDQIVIQQSLELANVLKLSDDELSIVAAAAGVTGSETDILAGLCDRYELQLVALTRGPHGARLVRGNESSDFPGVAVDVKDTVGAGDSFTAAMVLGLLKNRPLETINRHACEVAAFVCSQAGAAPALPDALRQE